MHEFGLSEGIVDAVRRRAEGRQVARVKVRVGALQRVFDEALRQAFSHAAEGTEAENAALEIVILPVRAVCRSCRAQLESDDLIVVCTECDGIELDLTGGDELVLESIEYGAGDVHGV